MLPYSAVDIVNQMSASFSEPPARPRRSLLRRLVVAVATIELVALWGAAGALTSLI